MRKVSILIGLCIVVALTLTITGQQPPQQDLSPVMKDVAHSVQELNRGMAAGGAPIVVMEAQNLFQLFTKAQGFFKAQKAQDAFDLAGQQIRSATAIMEAAQSNNLDGAKAPIKAMQGRCATCHMAHREQLPDKTFRYKP
jgi:cytochrome c556